jgi:hypothetical protein
MYEVFHIFYLHFRYNIVKIRIPLFPKLHFQPLSYEQNEYSFTDRLRNFLIDSV